MDQVCSVLERPLSFLQLRERLEAIRRRKQAEGLDAYYLNDQRAVLLVTDQSGRLDCYLGYSKPLPERCTQFIWK